MGLFDGAYGFLSGSRGNASDIVNRVAGRIGMANRGMGTDWFGQFGVLPTVGLGLQALTGLGDLWMGWNNYNLAKEAYDFQKALANRNLQNQGKIINNTYDTAANVGAGLVGGVDAYGNYGAINNDVLRAQQEQARKQYVDTSYIG